jgi:two-component system, chemotaxis family, protein-glutamate methylesterase/glutaminase
MATPTRDIIVIGASAGGVEALQTFARALPADFPGSIFITLHFPEHGTSVMPRILSRAGPLPAVHAVNGEPIVRSRIHVAPHDHHLLLTPHSLRVTRGPKENGNRPAVDPMFRSAAIAFGPRVIGVVLTGNLDDGTAGLAAIKRRGGIAVVQDPEDTLFPSMPRSAIENVAVDRVVPVKQMPKIIAELMEKPIPLVEYPIAKSDIMENDLSAATPDSVGLPETDRPGQLSSYGCPDCGGVLWELRDGEFLRFRCRVGHAWTADALLAEQSETRDDALWVALRALEESAILSRQIAARHRQRGAQRLADRFDDQGRATEERADVIRNALLKERGIQVTPDQERSDPRQAS